MIRTLLVEDDDGIRQLYRTILGLSEDFLVVAEASNGLAAIELAREHHPDLVLLDVMMPIMDGLAALPQVRAVSPQSKIVFLTALSLWLVDPDGDGELPQADAILEKATPPLTVLKSLRHIMES